MLIIGDPVPSFSARGFSNPQYAFDSVAGRYVVLTFIGSTQIPGMAELLDHLFNAPGPFDDVFASAFIVSSDPEDEAAGRLRERYPGVRVFWDMDGALARLFGCAAPTARWDGQLALQTWILDPALRVHAVIPVKDPASHFAEICAELARLPSPAEAAAGWAPVLLVPKVIEPELCREYIAYCRKVGTEDSGYMKTDPATGRTRLVVDYHHKRRADCNIDDPQLRAALEARVKRRLVPQIQRTFQFAATRMERYMIAAYDAGTGGHFRPHKDNTTLGTAHRRFAVTINLNAEEYEGGDLRFPEFGPRTYHAPTGGAIVFSCSLLHEATPMIRGTRYCILPFLYDEAAAEIRLENAKYLEDEDLRKNVLASIVPLAPAKTEAKPGAGSKQKAKKSRTLRHR